jgi:hypothetical protein
MKKLFPLLLVVLAFGFVGGGTYTAFRGFDAKHQVRSELIAQNITTTPDASMPNVRVDSSASAKSMADIIDHHMREATGGQTYSELGRYVGQNGTATNDATAALLGANGKPVANPLRDVAFQASALRTSLYTSVMAFNVADLVVGLGAMILILGFAVGGLGIALGGLVIPSLGRKLHVDPLVADYHPVA